LSGTGSSWGRPASEFALRVFTKQTPDRMAAPAPLGRYFAARGRLSGGRLQAYSTSGYGVAAYLASCTADGCPSCPARTPVEKLHAARSRGAFAALICASPEKRVAA